MDVRWILINVQYICIWVPHEKVEIPWKMDYWAVNHSETSNELGLLNWN